MDGNTNFIDDDYIISVSGRDSFRIFKSHDEWNGVNGYNIELEVLSAQKYTYILVGKLTKETAEDVYRKITDKLYERNYVYINDIRKELRLK